MEFFSLPDGVVLAAWILFACSVVVLLAYALTVGGKMAGYKTPPPQEDLPPVSVIIAARNEAANLTKHLPRILAQDYPRFEVIVVNHSSRDDTAEILRSMAAEQPGLRIVTIPENDRHDGGKKLAVTLGVKAAQYDRLLFTDADCYPVGPGWIRGMMKRRRAPDTLILGYAPYERRPGMLNAVIRADAWITATEYFGFALAGMPYMGVGRNLSYSKETFFEIGGFRSHYGLASGDDDLLVNQVATRHNTAVCPEPEAHVVSVPKTTWSEYRLQKRRHLTTGHRYKKLHRWVLMARPLAVAFLILSAAALLWAQTGIWVVIGVLVALFFLRIALFYRSTRWLGHRDILIFAPMLEVAVLAVTAAAHLANTFSKPSPWKK